jgi:hypothetical protein
VNEIRLLSAPRVTKLPAGIKKTKNLRQCSEHDAVFIHEVCVEHRRSKSRSSEPIRNKRAVCHWFRFDNDLLGPRSPCSVPCWNPYEDFVSGDVINMLSILDDFPRSRAPRLSGRIVVRVRRRNDSRTIGGGVT